MHLLSQAGELLLTLHAGIAQAESENKSENILTNEKYTGASLYGETESADFPSTKRMVCDPFEVHRSRNHHPPIIQERRFKRVQKLKAKYDAPRQLSNSPIGEATAFGALGLGIFIFMQKVVIAK